MCEKREGRLFGREDYSSEEFEKACTYPGEDLGANWSREKTVFRVWAPTASGVIVNLYQSGTPEAEDRLEQIPMEKGEMGTWTAEKAGDLNGVYYTYQAEVDGVSREACDPYARTTGVNGRRAMVIDLESTNPPGWDGDRNPHAGENFTDAVIYELHVRDLSSDPGSGIHHTGKFLGMIETGTCNSQGVPTGVDHIRELGITHLHLMPCYDYASVDEARLDQPQFNWGYDPLNFNVPEGSYATDPYHGEVRVSEMKKMIKGLHDQGISVIMDVVYNHVYDSGSFSFNQLVPGYFSRISPQGVYSNGSGCGNDTATERSMVRKYIVDSVKYWSEEYHIDGFRFDLVGPIDVETICAVMQAVHQKRPDVVFYGEGWSMWTELTKPGCAMTTQQNASLVPGFAFFSDTMRNALRGSVFDGNAKGFVSGGSGLEEVIERCFMGRPGWCDSPVQSVNYASCHDNRTLMDQITLAAPEASREEQVHMNNLAAAICLLSQGIPFFQAGEEMLRSKRRPDGGIVENSYNSPDGVNGLKWENLNQEEYRKTFRYYKGLIAFRRAHPVLRLTDSGQVGSRIQVVPDMPAHTVAFQLDGSGLEGESAEKLYVMFHAGDQALEAALPQGMWHVYIHGDTAGTGVLACVQGRVTVPPFSALVLVQEADRLGEEGPKEEKMDPQQEKSHRTGWLGGALLAGAALGTFWAVRGRKRQKSRPSRD